MPNQDDPYELLNLLRGTPTGLDPFNYIMQEWNNEERSEDVRKPTEKQYSFAKAISQRLNLTLPIEYTLQAYQEFISEHYDAYHRAPKNNPSDIEALTVQDIINYIHNNQLHPDAKIYLVTSLQHSDGVLTNIGHYEDGSLVLER